MNGAVAGLVGATGNTWLEVILTLSIVVPLAVVVVLAWVFLRGAKDDPDERRLRRVQAEEAERGRHAPPS